MNLITNKKLTKILMLIAVFVIVFTFMLPNYSIAKTSADKWGGKLFRPIATFIDYLQN